MKLLTSICAWAIIATTVCAQSCELGWTYSCYPGGCSCLRVLPGPYTWIEGFFACQDRGAVLADILSPQEQAVVASLLSATTWIGLSDTRLEGTFLWTDGSVPSYTNWAAGQPDGWGVQDCVGLYSGNDFTWYDQVCDDLLPVVCKKPMLAV